MTETAARLTAKNIRFIEEYLVDLNATRAASVAGYKSPGSAGYSLMKKPLVITEIDRRQQILTKRANLSAEEVVREIATMLRSDVRHFHVDKTTGELVLTEGAPDDAWRAVSSVKHKVFTDKNGGVTREIEFRLWSKPEATRMAGEYFKLYTQKHEIGTPPGTGVLAVPVAINVTDWAVAAAAQQAKLPDSPPAK